MQSLPSFFYKYTTQMVFFIVEPLFFLGFVLLYEPESISAFIATSRDMFYFNITMVTCIVLFVTALSRTLFYIFRGRVPHSFFWYITWWLVEMLVLSLFVGMYMSLISVGEYPYFEAAGKSLGSLLLILSYPFAFLSILYYHYGKQLDIPADESSLIRFTDQVGKLKIVVAADALLYIEAKENYVNIHYVADNVVKEYLLRTSMRSIEDMLAGYGIIRCQRSYYVNPRHVRALRREKEGIIIAQLDVAGMPPIPVSPTYYDNLSKLI